MSPASPSAQNSLPKAGAHVALPGLDPLGYIWVQVQIPRWWECCQLPTTEELERSCWQWEVWWLSATLELQADSIASSLLPGPERAVSGWRSQGSKQAACCLGEAGQIPSSL